MLAAVLTFGPVEAVADLPLELRQPLLFLHAGIWRRRAWLLDPADHLLHVLSFRSLSGHRLFAADGSSWLRLFEGFARRSGSGGHGLLPPWDFRGRQRLPCCHVVAQCVRGSRHRHRRIFGAAWGDPRANAEARALKQCGDGGGKACAIARTVCPDR